MFEYSGTKNLNWILQLCTNGCSRPAGQNILTAPSVFSNFVATLISIVSSFLDVVFWSWI